MGWRDTKIEDMEIAEGFATTLKTKHKIGTAGDLADRWGKDRLGFLLPKPGQSAVNLLVEELKKVSHGESGTEEEAPSTVKFEKPANGHASGNGASLPPGSRMGTKEELKEFLGQKEEAAAVPALPAVMPGMVNQGAIETELEATIVVPVKEWERLQKLLGRVTDVSAKSDQVQELKTKWAKAKDSSLAAKKTYDEATNELLDMIAGQLRLNFDEEPEKAKPAKEAKATTAAASGGGEVLEQLRSEPDSWRAAPLTVLPTVAADKKLAKRLSTGGLKSMGNLQDVRANMGEWPKLKEETKDKLIAEADEWLTKNRDAAAFAGAKKEADDREKEFPKQVELTKDILDQAHGNAVLVKAGTIMDTVKCADGAVGVGVGGIVMQLDAEEWKPVTKTVKRAKTILLVKDIPGFATEEDRCRAGAEFEVVGWSGECPLIKTEAGRETSVAPSEYTVLGDLVDWPLDEVA